MDRWFFGDSTKFWIPLKGASPAKSMAPVLDATCILIRKCQAQPREGNIIPPSRRLTDKSSLFQRLRIITSTMPSGVDRFMQQPIEWGDTSPTGKKYRLVQIIYREFETPDERGVTFHVIDCRAM